MLFPKSPSLKSLKAVTQSHTLLGCCPVRGMPHLNVYDRFLFIMEPLTDTTYLFQ